ncbi:hypothetical protein PHAVU_005G170800 [Phaseolus vulgaris]|uniref:DUF632 domain-containing protein n=1 Tax=Phaseolus vulgaris TaxID=3885 RepID=V7BZZ2_PHAVU|nr:hypothetical protein PHAVU_005G170800g [Phaseolus vulgaris]ESW22653.1 hypothetical protein PHAVU_005G170800g [Phaseolus vulgaris]
MGCNQSKIENEEAVARCKERKRFMKDAVSSRNAFAAAHSAYATCLKNTGAALGDFAQGEVQNPQLHSNDNNAAFPNPQPFEIPLPPPPLPDFSPAQPLQRAISMPEMKINKPDPRPMHETVGTIVEEDGEEDKESENEGSLRKRRSNNRVNGNRRVPAEEEQEPRPPMPPPPSKQPEPRDHITHHHHHSMAQDTQSGAWEYFFPSFENIAGPSLNAAEEDAVGKVHDVERKVFDEKPNRVVEEIDDEVVTPVRHVEVPVPEPEPTPEPAAVPDEMMETPVGKGVKLKQTPSSVEGKRIVKHSMNLQQIFADLDDNFLKASEAAHDVSKMLEATRLHYHSNFADNKGHIDHSARVMRVITWNRSFKGIPNVDDGKDDFDSDEHETHATILDKLLAWEKKLYDEVKAGELMKFEYQRKVAALNKLKKRGTNSEALEKAKAVVSHLHTRYIVDMQSLDSTVSEINRLRDEQLYPRLVQLVDGIAEMWKLMLEYHEKQSDTVKLLKMLDISQSPKQTSDHHHDRTYQLLLVVQQWHSQFEMLANHQKGYIMALNTWLKLNLIPIESSLKEKVSSPPRVRSTPIQGLLLAWNDRLEKLPDELAKTNIGNFVAVIDTIFHQQADEITMKRKCEDTRKELSRKTRQFEDWYNKYMQKKIPDEYNPDTAEDSNGPDEAVTERQVAVEQVKKRLEDEEEAYARQCLQVRQKTLGSLKNLMPDLFRAMSDFSLECSKMYSELRSISQNLGQSSS